MSQTEKIVSWIVKGGLLLTPLLVLYVAKGMYFPFITGKNFLFRILIEVLAVFWVWLMAAYPRYRPRLSAITIAYAAFMLVLVFATLFGISPYKSIWSSYERMEGLFGHLHFFLYFLMLASVFKTARDWKLFFNASIAVSAVVTIYAFVQLAGHAVIHQGGMRVDATLGNAIYLAVYLLFHLFLISIFFFQARQLWLKGIYGMLFVLETVILYYTASRGPLLGFLGGMILFALILAFLEQGRVRKIAGAAVLVMLLVPAGFFLVRNTEFVRSSDTLGRFLNVMSDPASRGRFTIWKMALKGWEERPILGWGQESFVYIFSKYYEPSLWRNEPWFDRAHNVFLDWLTASGVLGLGAYLAMFASALVLSFRAFRKGAIDRYVFVGVSALLTAHLFQNLFVFDNLTSYLLFFAVLAWVHTLVVGRREEEVAAAGSSQASPISPLAFVATGLAVVVVGCSLFFYNIRPMQAAGAIIDALTSAANPDPAGKVDAIAGALSRGIALETFGTTELREQANQIGSSILQDPGVAQQDKGKYITFVIQEMEKQRKEQPYDIRAMAFIANAYETAGRYDDAIATIQEALKISSRRQQFYFVAAEAYLNSNQPEKALEALRTAYELDPAYDEAAHNFAIVMIITGHEKEAEDFLTKQFGTNLPDDPKYAAAYRNIGRTDKVVAVWEKLVLGSPSNPQFHAELGSAYFQAGQPAKAIQEIQRAIDLEPQFRVQGEQIIKQIQATMGK